MAFAAMNGIMAFILYMGLKRENARRQAAYGPAPAADEIHEYDNPAYLAKWGLEGKTRDQLVELGDDHPAYRYII